MAASAKPVGHPHARRSRRCAPGPVRSAGARKDCNTSSGLGRMKAAEQSVPRSAPRVRNHQTTRTSPTNRAPSGQAPGCNPAPPRTRSRARRTTSVSSVTKTSAKTRKPSRGRSSVMDLSSDMGLFPLRVQSWLRTISAAYEPVSSGKTLTSTRRFFLLCSALLGSVQPGSGLSQPLPTTLNLFGSNLYLSMMALRTASARS